MVASSVIQSVEPPSLEVPPVAPFLRWAGGKRWLSPQVIELVGGTSVNRYHEPFLGGASIFFSLSVADRAYLSDLNQDLIEVYIQVRDHPATLAKELQKYKNTSEHYYLARGSMPDTEMQRAARFIFLNHTSYNGIFRVNLKGEYNVPFGNRKSTNIPDEEWLLRASRRLQNVVLTSSDFAESLTSVKKGDLVFLDPPYTVAHNHNGFVKYNQHLFSFDDQKRLAEEIGKIIKADAKFILTNAAHESIDKLFSPLGRKLTVKRRNAVGGKSANRGSVEEFIFTNIGVK